MELDIIAAVVIGGGSLSGGKGSALGSVLGALIMATLRNGCNMVGMPSEPWGASGTLPGFSAPTWESSKVRLQGTPLTIALSR
jgi:hypothetical protein